MIFARTHTLTTLYLISSHILSHTLPSTQPLSHAHAHTHTIVLMNLFLAFGTFRSEQQKLFIHILPSTLLVSVGYLITIAAANPVHGALVGLGVFGFITVCIIWWIQNTFFDKVLTSTVIPSSITYRPSVTPLPPAL